MTGRGSGYRIRRSSNPLVTVGISLSTSSSTLDLSSDCPFYVIVTAHILTSPHPSSPITLASHYNPFGSLHMQSFENIKCISPPSSAEEGKSIEIWPRGWPNFNTGVRDLREKYDFVTVPTTLPSDELAKRKQDVSSLEIKHEVPRDKIIAAQIKKGEKYRISLTDKGLGTYWWMFGTLEDVEGMKLKPWGKTESEGEDSEELEKEDKSGMWVAGEEPGKLALVVEKGEVEFEIV